MRPDMHHCTYCKACIEGYDHHCGVIGICIGDANFKYFILFQFYAGLMYIFMAISFIFVETLFISEDFDGSTEIKSE